MLSGFLVLSSCADHMKGLPDLLVKTYDMLVRKDRTSAGQLASTDEPLLPTAMGPISVLQPDNGPTADVQDSGQGWSSWGRDAAPRVSTEAGSGTQRRRRIWFHDPRTPMAEESEGAEV